MFMRFRTLSFQISPNEAPVGLELFRWLLSRLKAFPFLHKIKLSEKFLLVIQTNSLI